ncbi:MAG: enoyl-ACP reductase [SAR202 cluster bacterium]|nr:enoyl-ACP reductase [SAR202 cluster bacterium]
MYPIDLSGKTGIIFGVANHRSIAWSIAQVLHQAGARLAVTYQNERVKDSVAGLVTDWKDSPVIECDVSKDENVEKAVNEAAKALGGRIDMVVHSIAFANKDDLGGLYMETPREGFRVALDVSAYSLIPVARYTAPIMKANGGGAIVSMTFQAAERVFPGYNVMGTAKAALENATKQLASDLGPDNIRVNSISAGPLDTLSSRVISHYRDMKKAHAERSPMRRNITQEEVAKTALFLLSDLSSGITGEIVHVDTGYNVMGI